MKLDSMYPSKYLKAVDVPQPTLLTVERVSLEEIDDDHNTKPVVWFSGVSQGMVMNKTNAVAIGSFLGQETDQWRGGQVVLTVGKVLFKGAMVDSIQARQPRNQAPTQPVQPAPVAQPGIGIAGMPAPTGSPAVAPPAVPSMSVDQLPNPLAHIQSDPAPMADDDCPF